MEYSHDLRGHRFMVPLCFPKCSTTRSMLHQIVPRTRPRLPSPSPTTGCLNSLVFKQAEAKMNQLVSDVLPLEWPEELEEKELLPPCVVVTGLSSSIRPPLPVVVACPHVWIPLCMILLREILQCHDLYSSLLLSIFSFLIALLQFPFGSL